ncbi:MAG: LytTR family DNA-binding domain-containing protein [Muribaculaceae bacterium]|nr:LytTR family DNA-binding domain-containing protein [Muribaculaceae bacterium]MDE6769389.1 LytTR family DNA-binding domain-containing protein [Muribaculaceae bacterium]
MMTDQNISKIKVVIVDDDLPSAQLLAKSLSEREDITLCGIAETLTEGERLVKLHTPDLLFLDMEFPDSNGLEWYEAADLPANTKVVFHTCYRRYIHDALSLKVFDFLLKPFDAGDLDVILRRFKNLPAGREGADNSCGFGNRPVGRTVMDSMSARPLAITSVINSKIIVNPADIVYFRYISERKIWECVFSNLKRIILKRQTTAETILGYGPDFVRTHKHFIVNMRYVGIISGNDCLLLPPLDSITEIKISKSYRRDLMDRFYDI